MTRWRLAALLIGAMFVVRCGGPAGPGPAEGGALELFDLEPDERITLTMRDIAFGVERLTIEAGSLVAIELTNSGEIEHDLSIARIEGDQAFRIDGTPGAGGGGGGYALHVRLSAGASAEVRLRIDEPGEYEFFCAVPGHRRAGMRGTLVVR
ncbi:MAG: cupredoxin domain-containing protein [Dehalococcoidia bacterium]